MSLVQSREKDGTVSMRAAGIVARDPRAFGKVVSFSLCYRKDKFIDVSAWADSPCGAAAQSLAKGDKVAVDGILDVYTKGDKTYTKIMADFIDTQMAAGAVPSHGAASTSGLGEMEDGEDSEDGDLPF